MIRIDTLINKEPQLNKKISKLKDIIQKLKVKMNRLVNEMNEIEVIKETDKIYNRKMCNCYENHILKLSEQLHQLNVFILNKKI